MGNSKTLKGSGTTESGMVVKSGQATARMAERLSTARGTGACAGQAMATKSQGMKRARGGAK